MSVEAVVVVAIAFGTRGCKNYQTKKQLSREDAAAATAATDFCKLTVASTNHQKKLLSTPPTQPVNKLLENSCAVNILHSLELAST
jgi:hypothetical protein